MSHQVQLSPAASHRPTAVLDPAGHAAKPPACRSRCPPLPRPDMRRILSHPGNPICTAIFHTPAKDSRASPGPARQDRSARSCHGPLAGLRHLMMVLREYEDFDNSHRPHRALDQAAPLRVLPDGVTDLDHFRVRRHDRVGGVIHEYRLVA